MKRYLVLMFLTAGVLAACNNEPVEETTEEETPAEETDDQSNTDSEAEEESGESDESSDENSESTDVDLTAEGIIDESIRQYGDTLSYEMRHNYVISSGDEEEEIRLITTRSDQNELKVDVNTPDDTFSHYIIEGEHFIYIDGDFEFQEEDVDISGSSYGDIVSGLEPFKDASFSETEDGYVLTKTIENDEAFAELLPEELISEIPEGGAEGTIELLFNNDFQFNGSNLDVTMEEDGETYQLTSNSTIRGVGTLDVIEKPNGMSEQ